MKHSYDKDRAAQLVPLLEMIFTEVADRRRAIRSIDRELKTLKEENSTSPRVGELTAILANHKRELRLTSKEFERLGCVVDEHNPNRVIIPGASGGLERGYHWVAGATEVQDNAPLDSTVF